MFKRIREPSSPVQIKFEDRVITANAHDTVAAALLAAGVLSFRSSENNDQDRGPYCMIGNCFECRVEIDGRQNIQACQHRVRDGMQVRFQRGVTAMEIDDVS